MKIRVAYIIDQLPVGGTEKQLVELINRLDKKIFIPYLMLLRKIDESLETEIECEKRHLNINDMKDVFLTKNLVELFLFLKNKRIDILQTYFPDSSIIGTFAGRLAGTPCIISSRRDMGFWHRRNDKLKNKISNKLSSHILVNSNSIKDYLINKEFVKADKVKVIHNGVGNFVNKKIDRDCANLKIGIISNFNRYIKRLDVYINAMKILAYKYKNITFLIIGTIEDKHWNYNIPHDIKNRFVFTGPINNITEVISKIDIGVVCSDSEGFSNVILEYLANSIPSVCTNSGGNIEIIKNGYNGFLFDSGDFVDLAKKVSILIEDYSLWKKFSKTSLETVKTRFSWEKTIQEHEEYYLSLLDKRF